MAIGLKMFQKDLKDILEFVSLTGKDASGNATTKIQEFLLFVDKNKATISIITDDESIILKINIDLIAGDGKGEVPIKIPELLEILKSFNQKDELELIYDIVNGAGIISVRRDKPTELSYWYETTAIENIKTTFRQDLPIKYEAEIPIITTKDKTEIPYKVALEIDSSEIQKVFDDAKVIKTYDTYPLSLSSKRLFINIEQSRGNKKAKREIPLKSCKYFKEEETINSDYASAFSNLFNSFSGEYTLYLTNNKPIYCLKNTKNYKIKAWLMDATVESRKQEKKNENVVEEDVK